ncbi:hypothetical protein K439DRAFT_1638255 [Ramaria rubella]|nr:hypothetical protein K439DRAFT_1638255 [Ramaria rubella]
MTFEFPRQPYQSSFYIGTTDIPCYALFPATRASPQLVEQDSAWSHHIKHPTPMALLLSTPSPSRLVSP